MIPLLLCSIAMVYIAWERYTVLKSVKNHDRNFMNRIREQLLSGNIQGAKSLCKNTNTPIAAMIEKGIARIGKPIDSIEKAMENAGKLEVFKLEKNMAVF
jgi:biopolymer transport protein ExbB